MGGHIIQGLSARTNMPLKVTEANYNQLYWHIDLFFCQPNQLLLSLVLCRTLLHPHSARSSPPQGRVRTFARWNCALHPCVKALLKCRRGEGGGWLCVGGKGRRRMYNEKSFTYASKRRNKKILNRFRKKIQSGSNLQYF